MSRCDPYLEFQLYLDQVNVSIQQRICASNLLSITDYPAARAAVEAAAVRVMSAAVGTHAPVALTNCCLL